MTINEEMKAIDIEAERIAKWLNKLENNHYPYFINMLLCDSPLDYYEQIGCLEHAKSEIIRAENEVANED